MSQIKISNLTFAYPDSSDNVFEDVSFTIDTDWRLGFTGRNGRGKTTFLRLLSGGYEYKGTITRSVDCDYFPFAVEDKTKNTIDIIQQLYPDYVYWKISRELSLLNIDDTVLFRPFCTLSGGEQTKVMLAVLFSKDNNFLLIDEPTNHLDEEAREQAAEYLKSKKGFILVSHDKMFLDICTDHTLSINKDNIEIEKGNFSSWLKNKEYRDNFEISQNNKLKKEIKKLQETAAEKARWADTAESRKIGFNPAVTEKNINRRAFEGGKSKKMMSRAKAYYARAEKAISEKEKLLKNVERADDIKILPLLYHSDTLVHLKDISLFYGNDVVCRNISFDIKQGDRIALKGSNGCGKTSIIKLLCSYNIAYTGEYNMGSNLIISYVSQDTSYLQGTLGSFIEENRIDESLFKAVLRKLDFSREQFDKDLASFSEGQKKKLLIAKSLCQRANLYIWDEPLNYIDIFSRMQLEDLILRFKPTLLFVEHDRMFSEKIATKTVFMTNISR